MDSMKQHETNRRRADWVGMEMKIAQFCSLLFTALALVPGAGHVFELPAKIGLPQDQYLTVQQIYRGWAWLGSFLVLAIVANLVLTLMLYRREIALHFAAIAAVLSVIALAIFFTWTYPVNVATNNWTVAPTDWESLRVRWEYSHAAGAAVMFAAYLAVVLCVVRIERVVRDTLI
jgi:hypothetical protein